MSLTRRHWVSSCLALAASADIAAALAHARMSASAPDPKFEYLDADTAAELDALTARILPSDHGPGAREAGVVFFIDRALATFAAADSAAFKIGLADLQTRRKNLFSDSTAIHTLSQPQQIALIQTIEQSEFFELLRTHTILGFLGNPSYGGNRGGIGWQQIGFDHRMAYQPPFGYYDASPAKGSK